MAARYWIEIDLYAQEVEEGDSAAKLVGNYYTDHATLDGVSIEEVYYAMIHALENLFYERMERCSLVVHPWKEDGDGDSYA